MTSTEEETTSRELVFLRRRTEEESSHHGGVWKIAYADFMTAMMAFFLVMWLVNSSDKRVINQVTSYFNPIPLESKKRSPHQSETEVQGGMDSPSHSKKQKKRAVDDAKAVGGEPKADEAGLSGAPHGVRSRPSDEVVSDLKNTDQAYRDPFDSLHRGESTPGKAERAETAAPLSATDNRTVSPSTSESPRKTADAASPATGRAEVPVDTNKATDQAAARAEAAILEAQIRQAVAQSLPAALPHIDVTVTEEGVLVSLTDDYDFGMFAIASAEPRAATIVVMGILGKILAGRSEQLIIRGHTDGRPYKSGPYDNWRLSIARAHMAYNMLVRGGIDEKRFERLEGHADRILRVENDGEAAQNRRIEILLSRPKL